MHPSSEDLRKTYAQLADAFDKDGLDNKLILKQRSYFKGFDKLSETFHDAHAKRYTELDPPLADGSVRLLVVPLSGSEDMVDAGLAFAADMAALLPTASLFPNLQTHLHITIFHPSRPDDPRPDAIAPGASANLPSSPHMRPSPTQDYLARELSLVTGIVAASRPPQLHFECVVLTRSGTLLMTWTDSSGSMEDIRRRMREAFPSASTKQAMIIHTSLFRVISPLDIDKSTRAKVLALCDKYNQQLAGATWAPTHLWFINETEFSTIQGVRHVLPFQTAQVSSAV